MRVHQIPLTYPLHYERLLAFTTFPAWSTLHSTQFLPHLAVHHKLHPDQCTDACPLTQQTSTLQTTPQCVQTAQMRKKRKISRQYPQMMNTGLLKKTPERTFCIHKHGLLYELCQYPCPYENNNTISYTDSLDLSDISDYEDYMVTSSDEEILGMEKYCTSIELWFA